MNDLLLYDRIEVIKTTMAKYGEENFVLSFSGGKDSTVLHYLLDMAIPNNKIPRVYIDTGIEYQKVREFVQGFVEKDERFIVIRPKKHIKNMLEEVGYPFKSKEHSELVESYQNHGFNDTTRKYVNPYYKLQVFFLQRNIEIGNEFNQYINSEKIELDKVKEYIRELNLSKELEKSCIEKAEEVDKRKRYSCPKKLKYQFETKMNFPISKKCCDELKKKPFAEWQKENGKPYKLTGERKGEGGLRSIHGDCLQKDKNGILKKFKPLNPLEEDFMDWFVETQNIKLCDLYYEPYNFKRSGCVGCPYNIKVQKDLDVMKQLLPNQYKQAWFIWRPVYEEYFRLGYRIKKNEEMSDL